MLQEFLLSVIWSEAVRQWGGYRWCSRRQTGLALCLMLPLNSFSWKEHWVHTYPKIRPVCLHLVVKSRVITNTSIAKFFKLKSLDKTSFILRWMCSWQPEGARPGWVCMYWRRPWGNTLLPGAVLRYAAQEEVSGVLGLLPVIPNWAGQWLQQWQHPTWNICFILITASTTLSNGHTVRVSMTNWTPGLLINTPGKYWIHTQYYQHLIQDALLR